MRHDCSPSLISSVRLFEVLAALLFLFFTTNSLTAQNWATLDSQVITSLAGGVITNDPGGSQQYVADSVHYTSNGYINNNLVSYTSSGFFTDLPMTGNPNNIHATLGRLYSFALASQVHSNVAFATGGPYTSYAQYAAMGIDNVLKYFYNPTTNPGGNGYFVEVENPRDLAYIYLLIKASGQLSGADTTLLEQTIDAYAVPGTTCSGTPFCTGSNLADTEMAIMLNGIIKQNTTQVTNAVTLLETTFNTITPGGSDLDGFYADGSFIQHSTMAYTGHYGQDLLDDIATTAIILKGSQWAFSTSQLDTAYGWVVNSFEPIFYNGGLQPVTIGRFTADASTHDDAAYSFNSIALLSESLTSAQQIAIGQWIQSQINSNTTSENYYYSHTSVEKAKDLEILASLGTATALSPGIYNFPQMQRYIDQRGSYSFGVDTFSQLIEAFEDGGSAGGGVYTNADGWYEGAGTVYLSNSDQTQFDEDFWSTVNFLRLPGVTTDGAGTPNQNGYTPYLNPDAYVGSSVVDGLYASIGMNFNMTGTSKYPGDTGSGLNGWKSYFLLGDKMVALGAAISGGGPNSETIIENRKFATTDAVTLYTNGGNFASTGNTTAVPAMQWAALTDTNPNNPWSIGYYFLSPQNVNVLYEQRSGSINNISDDPGTPNTTTRDYVSLAFGEGCSPSPCTTPPSYYQYAVIPGATQSTFTNPNFNPKFSVLHNTQNLQAIYDSDNSVVGANFFVGTQLTDASGVNYLHSSASTSVTTYETTGNGTGEIDLGISDPTMANTGTIQLTLNRTATSILHQDAGVVVNSMSPQVQITVSPSNSYGRSFSLKLAENAAANGTGTDVADSYVWDGGTTTNYGTSPTIYVKSDITGYNRIAFMRFDISQFSGLVGSASLQLTPTVIGSVANLQPTIYGVANTTWIESGSGGIDWANMPAINSQATATFTVGAVNQPISINITSLVQAAQNAGATQFSLAIEGQSGLSGDPSVTFASKENSTAAYRPVLTLTR